MRVCVFGSSSNKTRDSYLSESRELGKEIAKRGMLCVNGGGQNGVMGALNDGCAAHGGKIKGVIHAMFCVDAEEHPHINDMVTVNGSDLWERKQLLLDNGDCVLVMPGGVGTFDELWESVSGKSLGMKGMEGKPVCLVNIEGFYDGFIAQLQRTAEDGMLYDPVESYFHVETDAISALNWCEEQVRKHKALEGEPAADLVARFKVREPAATSEVAVVVAGKPDASSYFAAVSYMAFGVVFGVLLAKTIHMK